MRTALSRISSLPPEQQSELDALTAEQESLCELDDLDEAQQARFDAIAERLDEFETRDMAWTDETLAIAGAVVTLGRDGEADIEYGYVRPENAPKKAAKPNSVAAGDKSTLPASLIESLTAHRSAALNAALLERPDVALAATVHTLAHQVFYNTAHADTVLQITANVSSLRRVEESSAHGLIESAAQLPSHPADLFAWCLGLPHDTLLKLLVFCVARTVNAVQLKADRPDSPRMEHAARLAEALNRDMAAWFTPTAANYFSRVSKAGIVEALREVKGSVAPAWDGMKKADLAALAERQIAGTGWLPEPLRKPTTETPQTSG
jgi:ParB family transcriptional regulator, chromosome partitioning protein